jgi:hypothetical protein
VRWINDNRGNVLVTLAAVILGVFFGLLIHSWQYSAEAVIGGIGNVTDTDNPHNLSNSSSGIRASTETRICIFCHTPHHTIQDATLINAPLWNHTLSTASYAVKSPGTAYSNTGGPFSITVNLLSTPPTKPDGSSRLCLSCHDGTVAIGDVERGGPIDMYDVGNSCIDTADKLVSGGGTCAAYIGNDLTQKHVVSIPMNQALIADSAANCGAAGQTHKVQYPWSGALGAIVLLRPTETRYPSGSGSKGTTRTSGKYKAGYRYGVQCSSCHDPHLWGDGAAQNGTGWKFLVTDFNSLCGACHAGC